MVDKFRQNYHTSHICIEVNYTNWSYIELRAYLRVQPEVDPGHDDQHTAGDIDGDQVVGELSAWIDQYGISSVGFYLICLDTLHTTERKIEIDSVADRLIWMGEGGGGVIYCMKTCFCLRPYYPY